MDTPIDSLSWHSSSSRALLRRNSSWTVLSRPWLLRRSSSSLSSRSMCSLVLARIARWASLSLALLRASCDGVKVETLRVPSVRGYIVSGYGRGPWEGGRGGAYPFAWRKTRVWQARLMMTASWL